MHNLQIINWPSQNQLSINKGLKYNKNEQSLFIMSYICVHMVCSIEWRLLATSIEWHNLGITTLTCAICGANVFQKITGKPNDYQLYLSNFVKFCDNNSRKLLRTKEFLKILEWSTLHKKIRPLPLLNVAAYWKSSNTEAYTRKLPDTSYQ